MGSQRINSTMVLVIASQESLKSKVCWHFGEVTWQMSSVISQLRLLTSLARISISHTFAHSIQRPSQSNSSLVTWPLVVLQVLLLFALSTHLISQEPDLLLMSDQDQKERESSMVSSIASRKSPKKTVSVVSIKVSESLLLVSFSIEHLTSVFSILVKPFFWETNQT